MRKDSYQRRGYRVSRLAALLLTIICWYSGLSHRKFSIHFQFLGRAIVWNDRSCFGPKFRLALVGQAIS